MKTDKTQSTALEIRQLVKTFQAGENLVNVLNGIDMTMARGEFAAVMGSSGSGKSSLLHLIAGLLRADSGEIRVAGELVSAMDDTTATLFRRRHIGVIFQDFNLIPTLTAEENITLPLLLGRQKPDPAIVEQTLERFDLARRRSHLPARLSGGERQRVAIARALICDPDIILADEPTGNLDSPAGRNFCDLLRQMNLEYGRTILLVSHDPVVAATAQRIHLLKDGRFVDSFATGHDPLLVSERYLKTAQMS